MMSLSIFIPAYNEEKAIESNINKVHSFLKSKFRKFEIVVVNDNSSDNTKKILQKLAKSNKIKVFNFTNGPSRRENLAVAMKDAKYEVVGFFDLDLSTPLDFLPRLYKKLNEGYDIAIGSRRVGGAKVQRSLYRLVWSSLYHKTIQLLFKSNVRDYQCGFKLFKSKVFKDLAGDIGYDYNFQRGWFWDAEMLLSAEKKGYSIYEMPISWKEGAKSSFDFFREFKTLKYILKKRFSA